MSRRNWQWPDIDADPRAYFLTMLARMETERRRSRVAAALAKHCLDRFGKQIGSVITIEQAAFVAASEAEGRLQAEQLEDLQPQILAVAITSYGVPLDALSPMAVETWARISLAGEDTGGAWYGPWNAERDLPESWLAGYYVTWTPEGYKGQQLR
jgi:hypothetical protein